MTANVQQPCTANPQRETAAVIAARAVVGLTEMLDEHRRLTDQIATARRHLLLLLHRRGLSYHQIGELTNLSKSSVADHIGRALDDEKVLEDKEVARVAAAQAKASRAIADAIPEHMTRPLTRRLLEAV